MKNEEEVNFEEVNFEINLEGHNDSNIVVETESFGNIEASEDLQEDCAELEEVEPNQFSDQELGVNKSMCSDQLNSQSGAKPQEISFSKSKQRRDERKQKIISWRNHLDDESSHQVLLENLRCLGLSKKMIGDTKSRKIVRNIMSRRTPKLPCPVALMSEDQL